jgi:hypothetical protein
MSEPPNNLAEDHSVASRTQCPMEFAIYEFNGEYGDVPPHDEYLRKMLFHDLSMQIVAQGANMKNLNLHLTIEGNNTIYPIRSVSRSTSCQSRLLT